MAQNKHAWLRAKCSEPLVCDFHTWSPRDKMYSLEYMLQVSRNKEVCVCARVCVCVLRKGQV